MSKGKGKVEKDTSERWLLTYADLMNLLLILFIILFAMSQVDAGKFQQLSNSLHKAFGSGTGNVINSQGGNSLIPMENTAPGSNVAPVQTEEEQMDEVQQQVSDLIEDQKLGNTIAVDLEERGIVISITAQLLFKSGSAELEPDSKPTIQEIGNILKAIPGNQIRIEGHTDTDPIRNSTYPSNWELSSARATNVLRLLVDKAGIDPRRISAVGYGEYRPKAPNTSLQNKALNRRVDIVIVKSKFDQVEAGQGNK